MEAPPLVRSMTRVELDLAVEWAAREGWNPGLDDATAFWAADAGGFLLAERQGDVLGAISAVKYGSDFGFVGFYIVRPELRGHRHGLALAEKALERLEGRNIGIDGVLAKQRQYAKFFGFQFAYKNLRYGGKVTGKRAASPVISANQVPFEMLSAFDRRFFPAPREAFLRAWIALPHTRALAWVEADKLLGYGVIRPCREGFKIGPLFAADAGIAEALFLALCEHTGEQSVFLDVPEVNPAAVAMAQRFGLDEVFATARMYSRGIPALPTEGIFGVTTFELG